uniref:Glycosyltransferase QUASIMODO1, putative n=1 Tax=Arundo donax TaxID=35708 RepID=A0A0A9DUJ6_ARUDO
MRNVAVSGLQTFLHVENADCMSWTNNIYL